MGKDLEYGSDEWIQMRSSLLGSASALIEMARARVLGDYGREMCGEWLRAYKEHDIPDWLKTDKDRNGDT